MFGYARVSTKEQNLDRQIDALKQFGINERDIITDKASGKNLDRQGYQAVRNTMLRSGDILVVKSLDRLGRNKADIKNELEYYKDNNIRVKVLDIPTTLVELPSGQEWVFDMINNILIEVLSSIAEEERNTIKTRQAEGIAAAKSRGVALGRKRSVPYEDFKKVYARVLNGEIRPVDCMKELAISKPAYYRYRDEYSKEVK